MGEILKNKKIQIRREKYNMQIIGDEDFDEKVLKSDKPVLVDFYADWCGPCRMMTPVIEQLSKQYEGRCHVYKINVDNDQKFAEKYKVMTIPTFILFAEGEAKEIINGAVKQIQIEEVINKYV